MSPFHFWRVSKGRLFFPRLPTRARAFQQTAERSVPITWIQWRCKMRCSALCFHAHMQNF